MDTFAISRFFEWDAAHRVLGHGGKCRHLHGHRYKAEVMVKPAEVPDHLDSLNMVIDFSVIKEQVGKWIDKNWDHNILLHKDDPLMKIFHGVGCHTGLKTDVFGDADPYVFLNGNPTAEIIAKELLGQVELLLPTTIDVVMVRVWETPNCHATCYRH